MKFDPNLYIQVNHKQRLDTKDVIGKYSSNFDWRSDGTDSLLDVGCGCADVTVDFILPILPEKFDRSVGIDTSKDMIDYARSKYSYQGLTFEQFDLELNLEDQPLYGIEPFDHITSFYCLHWIRNQEKVMKTFSKLLKPSGDALLTFVATHPQFEIIKRMSKSTKWAQYTDDVNRFIPIYHKLAKPDMELERVLRLSGFTDIKIDILDKSYLYEGTEYTTKFFRSINPFIDRIPEDEQDAYMNNYMDEIVNMGFALDDPKTQNCRFETPYRLFVVYAKK